MVFDRIIQLIDASTKIAFALAMASAAVFVGQYYGVWPFTLLQDQLGYVLYAGLVGAGVILFNFLRLAWVTLLLAYRSSKRGLSYLTVLTRLNDLTLEQQVAVAWIAHNPKATIQGSPTEEPFRGLCNKGFLLMTDKSLFKQRFRVNQMVYWRKTKINAMFSKEQREALVRNDAPWKRRLL